MSRYRQIVSGIIKQWPGEKTFGIYRFLPLFFALGAALEFSMINWTVGTTNFCNLVFRITHLKPKNKALKNSHQTPRSKRDKPKRSLKINFTPRRHHNNYACRRQLATIFTIFGRRFCRNDGRLTNRSPLLQPAQRHWRLHRTRDGRRCQKPTNETKLSK